MWKKAWPSKFPNKALNPSNQPLNNLHRLRSFEGRIYLVGGCVRDRLLGKKSKDIDFLVEGRDLDYESALKTLQSIFPPAAGSLAEFSQFRTVRWTDENGFGIDCARPRKETYPFSGSLPVVLPAESVSEELKRRDFTVNAIALGLCGPVKDIWVDPFDGRGDVSKKSIRILHENSFKDDPTRIFRALRFAARFGFRLEETTGRELRRALRLEFLKRISWERQRDELLRAFKEACWPEVVESFYKNGIDFGFLPERVPGSLAAALRKRSAVHRLAALYTCARFGKGVRSTLDTYPIVFVPGALD
ncbi:MAG: CCA tRNA nucleotidyltransferase [Elusimicrobia bacterium]|nr:CCA tRNA nucleotidyltransferase [Elusimicrobiota bacterium]